MHLVVCIPTRNASRWVRPMAEAIAAQSLQPEALLVIDSASTDGTADAWRRHGATVRSIRAADFDHGATRNLAFDLPGDAHLFLTQDAIPADAFAFERLLNGLFEHGDNGAAYGRQLARPGASPLAAAHRSFNYPAESHRRTAADVERLGLRAAFNSNAFAAYRPEAIARVGGFPAPIVGSEDRAIAARLLLAGWAVSYVAEACVEHSHDDGILGDFRRYFDIGAFQAGNPWFEESMGRAEGEGRRLLHFQIAELRRSGVRLAADRVIARSAIRYIGYRTGRAARLLPPGAARRLSANPAHWSRRPISDPERPPPS